MIMRMLRAAVVGASGFTGAELLRIIDGHPNLSLESATADASVGAAIADMHPALGLAHRGKVFTEVDIDSLADMDAVFLCLPHEASLELVPSLIDRAGCVIDLSAAFRLRDTGAYPTYYGFEHTHPELVERAVYGLPEIHRDELRGARLIATPGCYVTAAVLALRPLVASGLIRDRGIIVDAASGVTGAGRRSEHAYSFTTIDESMTAYGLVNHRHTPEMEQEIGAELLFTPHLVPMKRGILATCYAEPSDRTITETAVLDALREAYDGEPFVLVDRAIPATGSTTGSNAVHITARLDQRTGRVIVVSAIDNLAKGASGGAVQAANVALGLPETAGLSRIGVAP
ncbi:MAG: N-acetyl-gamma-glutamyl-phosphate reductase [Actinobacteria bacterium]|nr:N-acetyl-gamma-glutamyl-phosphate reductase [Actinomycetota bacterium]